MRPWIEELARTLTTVVGAGGGPLTTRLFWPALPSMVNAVAVVPRLRLMVSPAPVNCVGDRVSVLFPDGAATETLFVPALPFTVTGPARSPMGIVIALFPDPPSTVTCPDEPET